MKVFGISHLREQDFLTIQSESKINFELIKVGCGGKVTYKSDHTYIGFSKSDGWVHKTGDPRKHQVWNNTFFVINSGDEINLECHDSRGLEIVLIRTS